MPFKIRSGVRQGCALSPTLFNYIIDWILGQALQDYPAVQVGATVHVSDLAYADDIVILSSSYSEMQDLLDAVNRHDAAVGMRINASKTKVMSALVPDEPSCLMVSHWRMWKNSSTLAGCSWQTARAPRRSEAGLILLVPHSLAYNPVLVAT